MYEKSSNTCIFFLFIIILTYTITNLIGSEIVICENKYINK